MCFWIQMKSSIMFFLQRLFRWKKCKFFLWLLIRRWFLVSGVRVFSAMCSLSCFTLKTISLVFSSHSSSTEAACRSPIWAFRRRARSQCRWGASLDCSGQRRWEVCSWRWEGDGSDRICLLSAKRPPC